MKVIQKETKQTTENRLLDTGKAQKIEVPTTKPKPVIQPIDNVQSVTNAPVQIEAPRNFNAEKEALTVIEKCFSFEDELLHLQKIKSDFIFAVFIKNNT